jgi:Cd2+/Zn2+-exporting ATPase
MSDSLHSHKSEVTDACCSKLKPVPQHVHGGHGDSCCSTKTAAPALIQLSEAPSADARLSSFRIEAMDCPTEQTLIQNKLGKLTGVQQLEFNLISRVLGVTHNLPHTAPIIDAIKSLGMQAEPLEQGVETPVPAPAKKTWWPLALSGVGALLAEVIHFTGAAPNWVVAVIALISILSGGLGTYKKGWIALKNLNLNINALMSIAVTGAILIGQWPEAAMVMFLFTVAELIEAKSLDRARNAISGLMQMTPERATVLQADDTWTEQEVKTIELGARVRVRPGERIGLDGEVLAGSSTIDQAPITVEQAQGARAPTQRFVDSFSKIYTPAVFVLALAVAVIPPLFMGALWFDWIYRALVLLVVACPCALVISTPVTIVSGLAAAARKGILVKGGVYLEGGYKLDYLALDKTGTITHGKPVQTDYLSLDPTADASAPAIAAALAGRSDHPVSLAIASAAVDKQHAP